MKGKQKTNCTSHHKTKGMHEYKRGWRRPKWKALKGSKTNTQAHTTKGKEAQTNVEIEKLGALLVGRTSKHNNAFGDVPCLTTKIMTHIQNKGHHDGPHLNSQGTMTNQPCDEYKKPHQD